MFNSPEVTYDSIREMVVKRVTLGPQLIATQFPTNFKN